MKTPGKNKDLLHAFQTWYRSTIRNSQYRWLIVLGSLIYLLSPVDIAPDFIPVLGWVDDGLIATLLVTEVSQMMLQQLKSQKRASGQSKQSSKEDVAQNFTGTYKPQYATEVPMNDVIDVEAIPMS